MRLLFSCVPPVLLWLLIACRDLGPLPSRRFEFGTFGSKAHRRVHHDLDIPNSGSIFAGAILVVLFVPALTAPKTALQGRWLIFAPNNEKDNRGVDALAICRNSAKEWLAPPDFNFKKEIILGFLKHFEGWIVEWSVSPGVFHWDTDGFGKSRILWNSLSLTSNRPLCQNWRGVGSCLKFFLLSCWQTYCWWTNPCTSWCVWFAGFQPCRISSINSTAMHFFSFFSRRPCRKRERERDKNPKGRRQRLQWLWLWLHPRMKGGELRWDSPTRFSTQVGGRTPGFSGGEGWSGDSTVLQDFLEQIGQSWNDHFYIFFEDPEGIQAGKDQEALETGNSLEVPSRFVLRKPLFHLMWCRNWATRLTSRNPP